MLFFYMQFLGTNFTQNSHTEINELFLLDKTLIYIIIIHREREGENGRMRDYDNKQ